MAIEKLFHVSVVIEMIAGLYLLLFDKLLQSLGGLHWAFLLFYISVLIFLEIGYSARHGRRFALATSVFAILAFLAMLLDAELGLPLSAAYNPAQTFGWDYLFGFGVLPGSYFATSLAFTIIFIFSVIIFLLGLLIYRKG